MRAMTWPRTVIRRSSGLRTLESALYRSGLGPVAGVDEVGRGACAGPLVVAACVLGPNRSESLASLDDSKKLTEQAREALFPLICRYALAYHVVFISARKSTGAGARGQHRRDAARGCRSAPIARVMCCPTAFGARSADAVIAGDRWRRSRGLYRCRQRAGQSEPGSVDGCDG